MSNVDDTMSKLGPQAEDLRALIHAVSRELDLPLTESLKWGQPSFASPKGTPLRIGKTETGTALYAHCQSSVIADFAARFPGFKVEGNRAVHFKEGQPLPTEPIKWLIIRALTYRACPPSSSL